MSTYLDLFVVFQCLSGYSFFFPVFFFFLCFVCPVLGQNDYPVRAVVLVFYSTVTSAGFLASLQYTVHESVYLSCSRLLFPVGLAGLALVTRG